MFPFNAGRFGRAGFDPAAGGGGGGYTGPGDVSTAVAFYGLRAYTGAYATSLGAAIQLVDGSGLNPTDIHVTSAGILNASEIAAFIVAHGATTAISKVYDQTGGGHDIDTALSGVTAKPLLVTGVTIGSGTFPVIRFNGTTSGLGATNSLTNPQPNTISAVYSRTGNVGSLSILFGFPTFGLLLDGSLGNAAGGWAGGSFISAAMAENTFGAVQAAFDDSGAGSSLKVNSGSAGSVSFGTSALTGTPSIGNDGNAGRFFQGDICELFVRSGHSSSTVQNSTYSNQSAYYGAGF